ncbi:hypothetical protein MWU60_08650 [Yoonia sp. F2084L]|nr:hypothetical protein [Yoonia sp. F2084L]
MTQYLVESRVNRPRAGLLRKRETPSKSPNLFPGVDNRRSGRWLWIIWIFPVGAVVAYFAAHSGAFLVERDWIAINSHTHRAFCTALDIGMTYGAKFDAEARRAGCQ